MTVKLQPDVFSSAIQKIEWAKKHIQRIEKIIKSANQANLNCISAEDTPELGYVSLSIELSEVLHCIPPIRMLTGDAVHNMRCALDHAAWAIVSAYKDPIPRLYFPMGSERQSFILHTGFKEINSVAPDVADLILNEIKPYGAGNPFLALNRLDGADKHRGLLVHAAAGSFNLHIVENDDDVPEQAKGCFILVGNPTRLPALGSKAALHNSDNRSALFEVCFDPGLPFENEPVVPTLHQLSQAVFSVIEALHAHCVGQQPNRP